MQLAIFVNLTAAPPASSINQIFYNSGVWSAFQRVTPNDGAIYNMTPNGTTGGSVLWDPAGFTHLFWIRAASGSGPFSAQHAAIDPLGNVGPIFTFPGMTFQNTGFGRGIISNGQLLIPYLDDNHKPQLWRAKAGTMNPSWTTELVSSEVVPFANAQGTLPTIAANPNGTLYYFYPFVDFSSICQVKQVINSGAGWGAPTVFYDASVNPPVNDPGVGNQEVYYLDAKWQNGAISLGTNVLTTLSGPPSQPLCVAGGSIPAGQVVEVAPVKIAGNQNFPGAAIFFGGAWYAFTDASTDGSGFPFTPIQVWKSIDGMLTWSLLASLNSNEYANSPGACGWIPVYNNDGFMYAYTRPRTGANSGNITAARFNLTLEKFDIIDPTGPTEDTVDPGNWDAFWNATALPSPVTALVLSFKGIKVYPQS